MALRNQQVIIANVFRQDFLFQGYTAQLSVHYDKDDATIHYDDNGFLVRPSPIGKVFSSGMIHPHSVHAAYIGWTGDGHIGPVNLTHAFYQALGNDSFNAIAGRPVTINAQMAALERLGGSRLVPAEGLALLCFRVCESFEWPRARI